MQRAHQVSARCWPPAPSPPPPPSSFGITGEAEKTINRVDLRFKTLLGGVGAGGHIPGSPAPRPGEAPRGLHCPPGNKSACLPPARCHVDAAGQGGGLAPFGGAVTLLGEGPQCPPPSPKLSPAAPSHRGLGSFALALLQTRGPGGSCCWRWVGPKCRRPPRWWPWRGGTAAGAIHVLARDAAEWVSSLFIPR